MARGRLITFEGPEGAGKSTQAAMLISKLEARGIEVIYTREPGGTKLGEAIRGILQYNAAGEDPCPESEVLLFEASRAQLVRHVIQPALERGAWVLCDRFADSTTAYQGFGRGLSVELLTRLNAVATDGARPDLTVLLDLDPETGLTRARARNAAQNAAASEGRFEAEALAFHARVRQGYLELARRFPERFRKVDAMRLAEPIAEDVWKLVSDAFLAQA